MTLSPEDDGRDAPPPRPDLKKPRRQKAPAVDLSKLERLPPHDSDAEQGVLGCCLLAPFDCLTKCDTKGVLSDWFYDTRHATVWETLVAMHRERKPVDLITVQARLKSAKALDIVGGLAYLSGLLDAVPSAANLGYYLEIVREKHALRRAAQAATQFLGSMHEHEGNVEALFKQFSHDFGLAEKSAAGADRVKQIRIWDQNELTAYKPDPDLFLVGDAMLMRGDFAVLAGFQGIGKSRLTRTLGRAGAIGHGTWMGLPVKRKFRTLILQTEDNLVRLQSEFSTLGDVQDWLRCSEPIVIDLASPSWRGELREIFQAWQFDCLIIDNWTDVAGRQEVSDAGAVFQAFMDIFTDPQTRPLILFLAHMRKPDKARAWTPKRPWDLQHEVAGTSALAGKARTMFALQGTKEAPDGETVTFNVIKCNNETKPLPTAWLRANGEFKPVAGFDWEDYYSPPEDFGGRKTVTEAHLAKIFEGGPLARKTAVAALEALGFAQPTAYKALAGESKFADNFTFDKNGRIGWKGDE